MSRHIAVKVKARQEAASSDHARCENTPVFEQANPGRTSMAPDLLSTIRREIDQRLNELRPLLAEQQRLLGAVDALVAAADDNMPASAPASTPTKRSTRKIRVGTGRRGSAVGAIELAASTAIDASVDREANGVYENGSSATSLEKGDTQRTDAQRTQTRARPARKDKPERSPRGAVREAILAALEHGSHTVGELAVVTAMSGPSISGSLRKLVSEGVIVKTEREGKAAWASPDAVS
jgi:DNA-binding transcriptional ArsR family regulator